MSCPNRRLRFIAAAGFALAALDACATPRNDDPTLDSGVNVAPASAAGGAGVTGTGGGPGAIDSGAGTLDAAGGGVPRAPAATGGSPGAGTPDGGGTPGTGGAAGAAPAALDAAMVVDTAPVVDLRKPPVCGDGVVDDGEGCDRGSGNGLAAGDCNPGCTGVVTEKRIVITPTRTSALLGGVAGADAKCAAGNGSLYKALLVDGVTRVATITPFEDNAAKDWVLKPYTRYVNKSGKLIWTTTEMPLLGVKGGAKYDWLAPIDEGPFDGYNSGWAGLARDWTTSTTGTCNGWTSRSPDLRTETLLTTRTDAAGLPSNGGTSACSNIANIICVEQ